jgi:glutamine synthetase
MICNAIMASGMAHLAGLIEGGASHRDAVAQVYKDSRHIIFTGNGYSAEWPLEAEKRGLPNLNTTPKAVATWASDKNKKLFEDMNIFTAEETEARAEVMYEAYNTALTVEANTMVQMMESGIIPACVKDLAKYKDFPKMAGGRVELYESIVEETGKLKEMAAKGADGLEAEAAHLCDEVKPQMVKLRGLVDKAEGLLESGLYPYPTYEELLYSHHH